MHEHPTFSKGKFASFQVGVTNKQQVVAALGAPANWTTQPDGTSDLGYNDVQQGHSLFRRVKEARFTFDKNLILSNIPLPSYGH